MSWYEGANREERLRTAIARNEFAALVSLFPENSAYLTGTSNYIASHWRLPGLYAVVVDQSGERAVVAPDFGRDPVVSSGTKQFPYEMWTESIDVRGLSGTIRERIEAARPGTINRPAQFHPEQIIDQVAAAIRSIVGSHGRIGIEALNASATFMEGLSARLPGVEFVDATTLFDDLRVIKDADEVGHLRLAGELTEIGIAGAITSLRLGMTETVVNAANQRAVYDAVIADDRYRAFRLSEGAASVGFGRDSAHCVQPGETIKFDMQVDVAGYHSDIGRTVAISPTAEQYEIYNILLAALRTAESAIRPGVSFADIYWVGTNSVREAGLANYSRGHLGHSVGLTQNFEEPPFIAPDEHRALVPGMVISLELPYYVYGVGAFQLERMLLVTEDGFEALDRLPFELALPLANDG